MSVTRFMPAPVLGTGETRMIKVDPSFMKLKFWRKADSNK